VPASPIKQDVTEIDEEMEQEHASLRADLLNDFAGAISDLPAGTFDTSPLSPEVHIKPLPVEAEEEDAENQEKEMNAVVELVSPTTKRPAAAVPEETAQIASPR
jgi:hypothetical protein